MRLSNLFQGDCLENTQQTIGMAVQEILYARLQQFSGLTFAHLFFFHACFTHTDVSV